MLITCNINKGRKALLIILFDYNEQFKLCINILNLWIKPRLKTILLLNINILFYSYLIMTVHAQPIVKLVKEQLKIDMKHRYNERQKS